jgi:hypothetical protein
VPAPGVICVWDGEYRQSVLCGARRGEYRQSVIGTESQREE